MPLSQQRKDYHREYKRLWRQKNRDYNNDINRKHASTFYRWNKIRMQFLHILLD